METRTMTTEMNSEEQNSATPNVRLNKHGKAFVRQGFSQLLHTMRLAYNEAQKNSQPARINLEFRDGREGGVFIVTDKPSRNGLNCFATIAQIDGTVTRLEWTPQTETEIVWKGRNKRTRAAAPVAVSAPVSEHVPFVTTEVPVELPTAEPVVAEFLPLASSLRAVPETTTFQTKEDKMSMIRAAVERSKKARESRESLQALIAAGG